MKTVLLLTSSKIQITVLQNALASSTYKLVAQLFDDFCFDDQSMHYDIVICPLSYKDIFLDKAKKSKSCRNVTLFLYTSNEKDKAVEDLFYLPADIKKLRTGLELGVCKKFRVLVVDDTALIRAQISELLLRNNYEVVESESAVKALELLENDDNFDLICSDVEMPCMTGYEFCEQVKSDPRFINLPVIILTSLTKGVQIEKAFKSGANDYVSKPIIEDEFLTLVKTLTEKETFVRNERIVLIEPTKTLSSVMKIALEGQGFIVDDFDGAEVALNHMKNIHPDLILTSYHMKGMDGLEFSNLVHKDTLLNDIPIILLSSNDNVSDFSSSVTLGIKASLYKPFSMDKMIALVERIVAEHRLQKEKNSLKLFVSKGAWEMAHQKVEDGSGDEMWGSDEEMTILFSDLVGFTKWCEKTSPREVVDTLNGYFDVMTEVVEENCGFVDKFIGDAIMAIFPHNEGNGAENAVKAALKMQSALNEYNNLITTPMSMRIGVNTGNVILGEIGSRQHRRDFTVIGDNVNVAQRLESNAPIGGVLVSEKTHSLLDAADIQATPKEITVKGKQESVKVFEIISSKLT